MCRQPSICIFAGTTEGRELAEFLAGKAVSATVCVATDYGETLLPQAENLTVSAQRLPPEKIVELLNQNRFDLVVDATHPYAASITRSIRESCEKTGTEYMRLLRESSAVSERAVYVPDTDAAAAYLERTQGNILLTTGSKELSRFATLTDFDSRVYARVLPMAHSLELCESAGMKHAHILAMQGPFSKELNVAMLHMTGAEYLVTKDGGDPGGFAAKAEAAAETGAVLVVIGRPPENSGKTLAEVLEILSCRFDLPLLEPEITVVGIGPGNPGGMTGEVREAIRAADCLIGARRMLEAVAAPGQLALEAIAPERIREAVASHPEKRRFAVVMSGDSGFFSGTKKLLPMLQPWKTRVLPGLSSLSVLCSRLQTDYADVYCVSLHGRQRDICADVTRHSRVFALVGGENGAGELCKTLCQGGFSSVQVAIGQRLGYPDEAIDQGSAEALAGGHYDSLSAVLIENSGLLKQFVPGLPDEAFLRRGGETPVPMTKSEVRAVCLSKLRLAPNAVCWDIGAGTGSVSLEMALSAPEGAVYAIERKPEALELLEENRQQFRVQNLTVVSGIAPDCCEELPAPTHAFLGGTGGNLGGILELLLKKNPHVRIVATAIALETVAQLTELTRQLGIQPEITCLQVSKAKKAGPYHLMTGQNPVYIFAFGGEEP